MKMDIRDPGYSLFHRIFLYQNLSELYLPGGQDKQRGRESGGTLLLGVD